MSLRECSLIKGGALIWEPGLVELNVLAEFNPNHPQRPGPGVAS
ncbi:hypothetical protein DHODJN_14150 [Methylorubrum extorquens]